MLGHRNDGLYYIENRTQNAYFIIVNIHSQLDMRQIENIKSTLHIDVEYGLNIYENLVIWLYDAPVHDTHSATEYYCVWFFIEYVIKYIYQIEKLFVVKSMYRLVNEFWREHWIFREQLAIKRSGWVELWSQLYSKDKTVAVFGSGDIAKAFLRDMMGRDKSNPLQIQYLLDNDIKKTGMELNGLIIKHPSEIENWEKVYIIIAIKNGSSEVARQLETLGLVYNRDFMYYTDL